MKKHTYSLVKDLNGSLYAALLDAALADCNFLVLTLPPRLILRRQTRKILKRLKPYLLEDKWTDDAASAVQLGARIHQFRYAFNTTSATILKGVSDSLFEWRQPQRPENLSLRRPDLSYWLVTASGEQSGWFTLTQLEWQQLRQTVPGIEAAVKPMTKQR
jgi:hypothetical protein